MSFYYLRALRNVLFSIDRKVVLLSEMCELKTQLLINNMQSKTIVHSWVWHELMIPSSGKDKSNEDPFSQLVGV